ncbi:lanthionine synthetase C family protein [Streptomyces endophyticus]|uniref:Lanthionine synthetase C family protein n=1 Tax=Streptomyces endophyticus TaxID=714166 RepID=A0ABU6F6X9_9ACTN|nr:lanthionine synthetase C family protein [Streptomyces endophyticus]MEB8339773.1 lanthionine synthetase C family protein [Streptomyces endophyticus]
MPTLAMAAQKITDSLGAPPRPITPVNSKLLQSLAKGLPGMALVHIERAHQGLADWSTAQQWLSTATAEKVRTHRSDGLFYGLPSLTFVLNSSGGRGEQYVVEMDVLLARITKLRLQRAQARISAGIEPELREFDLVYGLTGLGAYWLTRNPQGTQLKAVLAYLARLTEPLHNTDDPRPAWWTSHDPHMRLTDAYPDGHGNFGMAHGITGPLALLSLALLSGVEVPGQRTAIERICTWLDDWEQTSPSGPWWPQWITLADVSARCPSQPAPLRPSWCYGTPGIARALQLAALATDNRIRRVTAERALAGCLADMNQRAQITDTSLCHGWAGFVHTLWHAARDAADPDLVAAPESLRTLLATHAMPQRAEGPGFLEGDAGLALVLHSVTDDKDPLSAWDACLLLNSPSRKDNR